MFYIYPELKAAYDEDKGKHAATEDSVKSLAQELKAKSQEIEHLKTDLVNIVGAFFFFQPEILSPKLSYITDILRFNVLQGGVPL